MRDQTNDPDRVSIERSIELDAGHETVWEHLTDGTLAGIWMEGEMSITPRVGGKITINNPDAAEVWGTVEQVVEGERIQWSWRTDEGMPTLVEIELAPSGAGTRITVRETLLPWQVSGPDGYWEGPVASAVAAVSVAA
jgi:uncharacterized protein YndB with AHSA1/START domain